jgi:hypothetical protein
LRLVVTRAAAVEEAVLLDELKRLHRPVFPLGFDDIGVGKKQDRPACARAVITNDEITFLRNGAADKDIGIGKTRIFQASAGGFGNRSGRASRKAGLDFDELLVDVVREMLFGVGTCRLGTNIRRAGEDDDQC